MSFFYLRKVEKVSHLKMSCHKQINEIVSLIITVNFCLDKHPNSNHITRFGDWALCVFHVKALIVIL